MKTKKPKISIIVPVYNMEELLADCINSILCQTYEDFEVILIDDGSEDRSLEICNEFAHGDSRIIVLHKENGGQGSARNLGLDNCRGEYICFIDSDDTIVPQCLEILMKGLVGIKNEISCALSYITDKPKEYSNTEIIEIDNKQAMHMFVRNMDGVDHSPVCKLFHNSLFQSVRFMELSGYEDAATIFQLFLKAERVAVQQVELYYYYQREGSTMHRNFSKKDFERVIAYRTMEKGIREKYSDEADYVLKGYIGTIFYVAGKALLHNPRLQDVVELCKKEILLIIKTRKISFKYLMIMYMIVYFPQTYSFIYKIKQKREV